MQINPFLNYDYLKFYFAMPGLQANCTDGMDLPAAAFGRRVLVGPRLFIL
jgi:hypothetical protein